MQEFLTFFSSVLEDLCSFLMSEPIIYFIGLFMLCMVAGLFRKLIYKS